MQKLEPRDYIIVPLKGEYVFKYIEYWNYSRWDRWDWNGSRPSILSKKHLNILRKNNPKIKFRLVEQTEIRDIKFKVLG